MPVYCITGTNRGIGLEFVRQLAVSPDNTIIAAVRSLSSDLTDLRAAASSSTHILECDTGSVSSIHSFVKAVARTLADGQKIDYLINNAGVNVASQQSSLSLGPDELHAQININVIGPAKVVFASSTCPPGSAACNGAPRSSPENAPGTPSPKPGSTCSPSTKARTLNRTCRALW
jgi:NAD(P)-dependent dehydrogenase (short-subunit alcohol dehydrogenase family)